MSSLVSWFLSWFGGDTQVALHPLIPNLPITNIPVVDYTGLLIPDCDSTDELTAGRTVSVDLSIVNECVHPDGFPRYAVLTRRDGNPPSLPGPVISGCKGDRFEINVTNKLDDPSMFTGTTVHWHGITQHHSNQMDGTAYVTQCPIRPGNSFLYNFTGGDQVGTFWYHSHYAVQYCDGLRGPFIIRDADDPVKYGYDVDNDSTIITLMDWYHYPSPDTPRQTWPDSVLIGGAGCYHPQTRKEHCPVTTKYTVEAEQRYRFRLLNMACKQFYNFTIDNHTMTVIEVDGDYVEPYEVDSIQIHPAQRYSFILDATQPINNYWIRAIPNPAEQMDANITAILRYLGAPEEIPKTVNVTNNPLNETRLRSLDVSPRLIEPNPDIKLNVVMNKDNWTDYNFLINDVQYQSPSVPILLQLMNGTRSWEIEPRESVYLLPRDQVVEITFHFDATPGRPHPFHLHGHRFVVMKSADSEYWNFGDKPVMRDTVNTGFNSPSDNVTIRFITDNPGPWILHCHNEWHLYTGMAIVFVEDIAHIHNEPFSNATRELCPYDNPSESWPLPPPRSTAGWHTPTTTVTCPPTHPPRRGV